MGVVWGGPGTLTSLTHQRLSQKALVAVSLTWGWHLQETELPTQQVAGCYGDSPVSHVCRFWAETQAGKSRMVEPLGGASL